MCACTHIHTCMHAHTRMDTHRNAQFEAACQLVDMKSLVELEIISMVLLSLWKCEWWPCLPSLRHHATWWTWSRWWSERQARWCCSRSRASSAACSSTETTRPQARSHCISSPRESTCRWELPRVVRAAGLFNCPVLCALRLSLQEAACLSTVQFSVPCDWVCDGRRWWVNCLFLF